MSIPATSSSWRTGAVLTSAISILFLLGAVVQRWPYGYYTLLRVVVCGTALYLAVRAFEAKSPAWAIILCLTGLVFNPILPLRMRRAEWQPFDVGAAIVIAVATIRFGRTVQP